MNASIGANYRYKYFAELKEPFQNLRDLVAFVLSGSPDHELSDDWLVEPNWFTVCVLSSSVLAQLTIPSPAGTHSE